MQPTSPVTPSIAQYRCKKPRPLAPCRASNNGWFHRQGLAPSYRHNCSPELPLLLMKIIGLPVAASLPSSGRLAPRTICHPCQLRSEARIPTLVSSDAPCRVPTLFLPVRETRLPRLGFFPLQHGSHHRSKRCNTCFPPINRSMRNERAAVRHSTRTAVPCCPSPISPAQADTPVSSIENIYKTWVT